MPTLTDEKLFDRIKNHPLVGTYFLFGQESYFTTKAVDKLIKKAVDPAMQSFNLTKFAGDKVKLDDVYQAVESMPMMADRRCVIVKDLDIDKLAKEDYNSLLDILALENETTIFIIYATEIAYDSKKSSRVKKISALVEKNGIVCEFSQKDKSTLKRALCAKVKKDGLSMDMTTADKLVEQCGSNYSVLLNELEKLIFYTKGIGVEEINPKYIDFCSIPSIDSTSFDLAKAILAKRFNQAFLLLDELFYQRVEALAILGALNMCFIDLYRARVCVGSGKSQDEMATTFSYPANRKFAIKNAFRDVQGVSIESIRGCINALMEADITLKSSKLSDRLILEQMLAKMGA